MIKTKIALSFYIITLLLLLGGCDNKPSERDARSLFEHYCAHCHKPNGKGKFLKGIPPNVGSELSVAEIVVLIRHGNREFMSMPPIKDLSQEESLMIARYLKHELGRTTTELRH